MYPEAICTFQWAGLDIILFIPTNLLKECVAVLNELQLCNKYFSLHFKLKILIIIRTYPAFIDKSCII